MNGASTSRGVPPLPKTIEGATIRYLTIYEKNFVGPPQDKTRLSSLCHAKIRYLRKMAPSFYETKLPTLVNQAANSLLLNLPTDTEAAANRFHTSHRTFLHVLDNLVSDQPSGEVHFQVEVKRITRVDKLKSKQNDLRKELMELETIEFDIDEMGDDIQTSSERYRKAMEKMDHIRVELRKISYLICRLEGVEIEDDLDFKLTPGKKSSLYNMLTQLQVEKLEQIVIEILRNGDGQYVNIDVTKARELLERLEPGPRKFNDDDYRIMADDLARLVRENLRKAKLASVEQTYDDLIHMEHLRPREGIVLENPDDIPLEIAQTMTARALEFHEKFEEQLKELKATNKYEEVIEDETEADLAPDEPGIREAEEYISRHTELFARIKEEPNPDLLPDDAEEPGDSEYDDESVIGESDTPKSSPELDEPTMESPKKKSRSDSQDLEMLGTVEPQDKVDCIVIDDDD